MGFSRQEYWSGTHSLLQGIFLTQGLNPGLLHCRQILYCLSHQRSPVLHMVVYIYQCYSLNSSYPHLSLLCLQVHSLCLHLYSHTEDRFISTISLDSGHTFWAMQIAFLWVSIAFTFKHDIMVRQFWGELLKCVNLFYRINNLLFLSSTMSHSFQNCWSAVNIRDKTPR